jgi:hypothetical protein
MKMPIVSFRLRAKPTYTLKSAGKSGIDPKNAGIIAVKPAAIATSGATSALTYGENAIAVTLAARTSPHSAMRSTKAIRAAFHGTAR